MKKESYENITKSADSFEYEFTSVGPKGEIAMVVRFTTESDDTNVVSLALGNVLADGNIDDEIRNNNKDRNKILATVAAITYKFTTIYPEKIILFSGSTPARTRLYRMAIAINLEELLKHFIIYGSNTTGPIIKFEEFKKQVPYHTFAVKRKTLICTYE